MSRVSQVSELLEELAAGKAEAARAREARVAELAARRAAERRAWLLRRPDCSAKHSREWNPSINMDWFHRYKHMAMEPNPSGKPFDAEDKSLWPVIKGGRGRGKSHDGRALAPWYAVRSGQLFKTIPHDADGAPAGAGEVASAGGAARMACEREREPPAWKAGSGAPGRLFSSSVPDPSLSTQFSDKLAKLRSLRESESRDPWLPTSSAPP
jgi:hypothetical protein